MRVVDRKISELISAEYNPRYITGDALEQLKDSIKRFDAVEPVLVNMNKNRKNIIISGHQRIRAAKDLDMKTFPCVELNLSIDKEREHPTYWHEREVSEMLPSVYDKELMQSRKEYFKDALKAGVTDRFIKKHTDSVKRFKENTGINWNIIELTCLNCFSTFTQKKHIQAEYL